jgi:uncharacterized membrane protein YtjA (UPF0391 family)
LGGGLSGHCTGRGVLPGGIASAAAGIAKVLFFLFVVFVILFSDGLIGRRRAL